MIKDFKIGGCFNLNSLYLLWQPSNSQKTSLSDYWSSASKVNIAFASFAQSSFIASQQISQTITGINPSLEYDFRVFLSCDNVPLLPSQPYSILTRAKLGQLSSGVSNSNVTLNNLHTATFDVFNYQPDTTTGLITSNWDNKVLRFISKSKPLLLLNTENITDFSGQLKWNDQSNGFLIYIQSSAISESQITAQAVLYNDRQMNEKLSYPITLSRVSGTNSFTSSDVIGGIEIIGHLIYIFFGNVKIPFMTIFSQSNDCMVVSTKYYSRILISA